MIFSWLIILGIAVAALAVFMKPLSSNVTIPGTKASKVLDRIEEELPNFGSGSGMVLFTSSDDSALTEAQKASITEVAKRAESLPHVSDVIDPFKTDDDLADQQRDITDGRDKISDGRNKTEDGQKQLDAAQKQLKDGSSQLDDAQDQLDAAKAQLAAAGQPTTALDAQQAQLDAQREQLEKGEKKLEKQQRKLDDGVETLDDNEKKLDEAEKLLGLADGINVVSDDDTTAIVTLSFDTDAFDVPAEDKDAIIDYFEDHKIDGVKMSVTNDIAQSIPNIIGAGEVAGLLVAAVVLVVMLGTLIAAAFPLITALTGVGVGVAGSLAFSGLVEMTSVTPVLGMMLGVAVGLDYSLFILNRHRKQLKSGVEVIESAGLANGTSGNAVVFAGSTVVIALLALNVVGIPFLGVMGTVGGASVLIAVLVAITLTPALLGLAKLKVLSKKERALRESASSLTTDQVQAQAQVKPMRTWNALLTAVASIAVLLVVAIPALDMRVGLPDGASEPKGEYANTSYHLLADKFGEGQNGTLVVTADLPPGLDDDELLEHQVDITQAISDEGSVAAVAPVDASDDNTFAVFQVVPEEGPNSESTEQLVKDLRELTPAGAESRLGVASQTAMNIDISQNLNAALPLYLVVVVGLSLLIMIMVFRSLLVPIIATGGFVLSLFATFGATTAVFQWGWGADLLGIHAGPILSFLPVILTGVLFGLAMDYQLFLASGMREAYAHGTPARAAVVKGRRAGRAVVTAAGLIMISVFAGFIFSEVTMIRSIGFGLAFGVLVDAFIVRMLLMPALMHLVGKGAWWLPKWLSRLIPDVDVEGAALERKHHVM